MRGKLKKALRPLCGLLAALSLLVPLTACGGPGPDSPPDAPDAPDLSEAAEPTDIAGHPAETYILEGLRLGLYPVPPDGLFRPDEPATRSEFIIALWRLAGQPDAPARKLPSAWSAELRQAVSWADAEKRLDSAASAATFDPDEPMTRLAAMESLFALNGSVPGVEAVFTSIYDEVFEDSAEIPPGAKPALYWGFYYVLIREPEPGRIAPSGAVSRGDMAEMMTRYLKRFIQPPENSEKEESIQ